MGLRRADYICLSAVERVILWHRQQRAASLLGCWRRRWICMRVCVKFSWGPLHITDETLTPSVVQLRIHLHVCTSRPPPLTLPKWHQTSVCCHCGNTAGVGCWAQRQRTPGGKQRWPVGERNNMREGRRRDDQINHAGHSIAVRKGLIYPPPLCPHGWKANVSSAIRQQRLCQDTSRSSELRTEVIYCRPRVCAPTHHCGPVPPLLAH